MRGKPKLIKRKDSPYWFIYIPQSREFRAQRLTTGTGDYNQAEAIFAQWLLERKKPELTPLDEIKITDMLERYSEYKKEDVTVGYHMRHLKPYFKNIVLSQINNLLLREYTAHRTSQKVKRGNKIGNKLISQATVRRELDTFSASLGLAHKDGYIKDIPYIEKPQASPPRERWLTVEEYARLLAACERDYLKIFIAIAMATSARPSSIFDLKWFQIDWEARLIHFNPPGRRQTHKHRPSVYINEHLYPLLEKMRDKTASEYIISRKNGTRVRSIKKGFEQACARAGLEGVTPYTLRHTAITWAIQGGKSLAQAGQLAGHKEPRTTSRYAKHDPSFTKDTVAVLATGAQLAHKMAEIIKIKSDSSKNKVNKQ